MATAAIPAAETAAESSPSRRVGLFDPAREFARYGSPRIMVIFAVAVLAARVPLGHWSLADLAVAGGILAVEPFVEWVIHVFLLHFKPRRMFGRQVDPIFAKRHRMHHRNPRNVRLVFVPLPVLAGFLALLFAIAWFAFPTRYLSVTAFTTCNWFFCAHEWTRYLSH